MKIVLLRGEPKVSHSLTLIFSWHVLSILLIQKFGQMSFGIRMLSLTTFFFFFLSHKYIRQFFCFHSLRYFVFSNWSRYVVKSSNTVAHNWDSLSESATVVNKTVGFSFTFNECPLENFIFQRHLSTVNLSSVKEVEFNWLH